MGAREVRSEAAWVMGTEAPCGTPGAAILEAVSVPARQVGACYELPLTAFLSRCRHAARVISGAIIAAASSMTVPATADDGQLVATADGITFRLPSSFREVPATLPEDEVVRLYMDPAHDALTVAFGSTNVDSREIVRSLPIASGRLPLPFGEKVAARWIKSFNLIWDNSVQHYYAQPLAFDKERHAFWLKLTVVLASPAWRLLQQDESSAEWQVVRQSGETPSTTRCLLGQLLSGATHAALDELRKNIPLAAQHCQVEPSFLEQYVALHGRAGAFERALLTASVVTVITKEHWTFVSVVGPEEEEQANVEALGSLIWSTADVSPGARIQYGIYERLREAFSLWPANVHGRARSEIDDYARRKMKLISGLFVTVSMVTVVLGSLLATVLAKVGVGSPRKVFLALVCVVAVVGYGAIALGYLSANLLPPLLVHSLVGLGAWLFSARIFDEKRVSKSG